MRDLFIKTLKTRQNSFSLSLTDIQIERLAKYYDLVREQNEVLNLVAPMTGEEFAIRHILESLTLLEFLPKDTVIADVGTGAGLPSIPCLIVRDGLRGLLIESKEKKIKFLASIVEPLRLADRVTIVHKQFEETDPVNCEFVTCRALDKFTAKLPKLLRWARPRGLLLFGGNNLAEALTKQGVRFDQKLMPLSEQRFLFIAKNMK
ncbi:MAG: 16S rRNA (guanine(527)-N(7))-methyltransferase RsmG [Pyrinomonadaceae bacterium]